MAGRRVVVLPDFYVDAVARVPAWDAMAPALQAIAARGGGNLPIGPVDFKVGGQAANVGVALSCLGASVDLVAETDAQGKRMLQDISKQTGLGVRHVAVGAVTSATLALESPQANLMLSHSGPLRRFGPAQVSAAGWRAIEAADAVVLTNWSQDERGTALLAAIARRLRGRKTFLYVDTGDLRHRAAVDVRALLSARAAWARVDAWGLNENEILAATAALGDAAPANGSTDGPPPTRAQRDADVLAKAQALAQRLGTRLDVHTRAWAASVPGKPPSTGSSRRGVGQVDPSSRSPPSDGVVRVAAPRDRARRLTGAGDTWNAGNLAGHLLGLEDAARLRLAHAVATRYVIRATGLPPSWREVPVALWRGAASPRK